MNYKFSSIPYEIINELKMEEAICIIEFDARIIKKESIRIVSNPIFKLNGQENIQINSMLACLINVDILHQDDVSILSTPELGVKLGNKYSNTENCKNIDEETRKFISTLIVFLFVQLNYLLIHVMENSDYIKIEEDTWKIESDNENIYMKTDLNFEVNLLKIDQIDFSIIVRKKNG